MAVAAVGVPTVPTRTRTGPRAWTWRLLTVGAAAAPTSSPLLPRLAPPSCWSSATWSRTSSTTLRPRTCAPRRASSLSRRYSRAWRRRPSTRRSWRASSPASSPCRRPPRRRSTMGASLWICARPASRGCRSSSSPPSRRSLWTRRRSPPNPLTASPSGLRTTCPTLGTSGIGTIGPSTPTRRWSTSFPTAPPFAATSSPAACARRTWRASSGSCRGRWAFFSPRPPPRRTRTWRATRSPRACKRTC
ncbi:hypothetical protein BU14_2674s0001 [Porphyra umbilicalis]|uniref:Uncharacterized protein n=1 Tax=Porphyra umbilicalis TaxID=2786 RepID=A0A1X6NIR6_PORUM|nr:hypothetical protein BU14_2674s0001 [Porphyra umbilicalis]|eukprot:OSX68507.1 hypothetical protein BU14_2674s0001 [Porphyra umbilicalis]